MMVVRVHEDEGVRTGLLVAEGPAWMHFIWADSSGVKITKLPNTRALRVTAMPDYPIARAKKFLRGAGKKFGITKAAKKALRA